MKQPGGWTPAKRARYRRMMLRRRPWVLSTGPRSVEGKRRVRLNARKHGLRSRVLLALARYVRVTTDLISRAESQQTPP
jgi:hypothetical protein